MKNEPQYIDIDDSEKVDSRPVEVPVISIERTDDPVKPDAYITQRPPGHRYFRLWTGIICFCAVALCVCVYAILIRNTYGLSASVSDEENRRVLNSPYKASAKGTVHNADSVLGVGFDIYSLEGLKASLEIQMPDTANSSLVLFMRSADYKPDGRAIGTLAVNGEFVEGPSGLFQNPKREGYIMISPEGKPAIGISKSDRNARMAAEHGGHFFRQFVLLADGELPPGYQLHGKVPRAAIGRTEDGSLHYVVTRHNETMYDFADAMREYGFLDAIYLTGGNSYDFWRDTVGNSHVSERVKEKLEKYSGTFPPTPMLVFRRAGI